MKYFALLLLLGTPIATHGQVEPQIISRSAHSRVWERSVREILPGGRTIDRKEGYMEIAVGLYYRHQQEDPLRESREQLELFENGAVARELPCQIIFAPNAASAGAIDLLTPFPEQQRLRCHVLGIGLFDNANGNSILLATTKESIGQLHAPRTIVYPDAFDDLLADIRYTVRKGGLSQDVVLKQQIAVPPAGFNQATTMLEVWTEFEAPVPEERVAQRAGLPDSTIRFGSMSIGPGKAFSLAGGLDRRHAIPVYKRWLTIEQRSFLIEAVRLSAANAELARMGFPQAALPRNEPRDRAFAANQRPFPKPPERKQARANQKIETAQAPMAPSRGLVVDWELNSNYGSLRLQGESTYFLSDHIFVTNLVIEGGCVVKVAPGAILEIAAGGTITCLTAPFQTAVFTSKNDETAGSAISGSTGSPAPDASFGFPYLYIVDDSELSNIRFSYGNPPIYYDIGSGTHTLNHAQFVHCPVGIWIDDAAVFKLGNVLMYDLDTAIYGNTWSGSAEHLTVHKAAKFAQDEAGTPTATVALTNSLLVNVTNWGNPTITTNCTVKVSGNNVLQRVGGSESYLAPNSPFRNIGTASISPSLAKDLRKATTYPPVVLASGLLLTNNVTLFPNAQRDTDAWDLGYHPWALDYVVTELIVTNAALILSNGVVVGTRGTTAAYAIALGENGSLISQGTPDRPNRIVRYNTVQEQSTTNWASAPEFRVYTGWTAFAAPTHVTSRFTHWITLAGGGEHFYSPLTDTGTHHFRDSEFYNADILSIRPTLTFTNCLFSGVGLNLVDDAEAISPIVRNCTLRRGTHNILRFNGGTWVFQNNIFEEVTDLVQDAVLTLGYNRYSTNSVVLTSPGTGDQKLTLTNFAFQSGALGRFYLATNLASHSSLFDSGSMTASNFGLYSFTAVTNQTKEAGSVADLGYHVAATDGNGVPLDYDLDGLVDVFEDLDGDGYPDGGETNWQEYNSLFGIGAGPGLVVFTPLK